MEKIIAGYMRRNGECQFLIGNVYHPSLLSKNSIESEIKCQFLIGNVYHVILIDIILTVIAICVNSL